MSALAFVGWQGIDIVPSALERNPLKDVITPIVPGKESLCLVNVS
jgi:hypothetical protein